MINILAIVFWLDVYVIHPQGMGKRYHHKHGLLYRVGSLNKKQSKFHNGNAMQQNKHFCWGALLFLV